MRRTPRSVNITEEALAGAVARTTSVLAAEADSMAEAEADSIAVAADTRAARVFGAGGQPRPGKRVVARPGDLVDWPRVRTAIRHTSEATWLARMARGVSTAPPDDGWVALMEEQLRRARARQV